MTGDTAIECPQCGRDNDASAERCANCDVGLKWALERGRQYWTEAVATRPPLILVSDDDRGYLQLTGLMLERAGYRIATARNPVATIDLAYRLHPDLIVTDIGKPAMSGFEMIALLKENPALRDIPVVILSARIAAEDIEKGFEVGAAEYLTKPVLHHDLTAAMARVLDIELPPLILFVCDELTPDTDKALSGMGLRWSWRRWQARQPLAIVNELEPDVIAVAFRLADTDGLDVLAQLKAEPDTRDIPVVMLADDPEPQLEQRAMKLGAHAVYTGPLDAERLHEVFRAALEEG